MTDSHMEDRVSVIVESSCSEIAIWMAVSHNTMRVTLY